MPFPLRLTPFEEYLYRDDYRAYPNTITCRLRFDGQVDASLLQEVGNRVINRQPMVNAIVQKNGRTLEWHSFGKPDSSRAHTSEQRLPNDREYPKIGRLDLTAEPGQKAIVRYRTGADGKEKTEICFLTHHACCDGLGGLQVIHDWMCEYHNAWTGSNDDVEKQVRLRRLDPELLKLRGDHGFRSWQFMKKLPRQAIGLAGVVQFLMHKPVALIEGNREDVDSDVPEKFPQAVTRALPVALTERLQKFAASTGTTVNDRVARELFVAIAKWREQRKIGGEKDWLRVLVPMNVRQMRDRRLPGANRASFVALDRRQAECEPTEGLLQSIRDQMNVIIKNELHFTYLLSLRWNKMLPGGLARTIGPDRKAATCLFTNLHDLFGKSPLPRVSDDGSESTSRKANGRLRVGNLVLEGYDLLAPLRPFTQIALAVSKYNGETLLTLNFDPRVMDLSDAEELIDSLVGLLDHRLEEK